MTMQIRLAIAGMTLLGMFALIQMSTPSYAAGDKKDKKDKKDDDTKDHTPTVEKIAAAIKKGDLVAAKKLSKATVDDFDLTSDMMHLYRTRYAGGVGFGPKEGPNKATDGIEKKLKEFEKAIPATFPKESANYEAAGYWMAALAEMTAARRPEKDKGPMKVKDWDKWSNDLRDHSIAFAKASVAKDAKALKTAADKISNTCAACHYAFKPKSPNP